MAGYKILNLSMRVRFSLTLQNNGDYMKKKLPKYIQRVSDGDLLVLNEDGETYSFQAMMKRFPDNLHHKYSYDELMGDCLCAHCHGTGRLPQDDFRVLDL